MISKINHLLPIITLNEHLSLSWKCIRRTIFINILKTQTSPLEGVLNLGLGYFNIIIKPMLRMMEREYLFFLSNTHIVFLKKESQRALLYWKSLEQKIPEKTLEKIDEMINETSWYSSEQLNESIYEDIEQRLIRNSTDRNLSIKDRKNLISKLFVFIVKCCYS